MEPDPEPEEPLDSHTRPRTRVGQFFVNAFRPLSTLGRKESSSSVSSVETPIASQKLECIILSPQASRPESIPDDAPPFSRFVSPTQPNNLRQSRSNESLSVMDKSKLRRRLSHDVNARIRRSFSVAPSPSRSFTTPAEIIHRSPSPPPALAEGKPLPPVPLKDDLSATPLRWGRFFPFPFLSRDSAPNPNLQNQLPTSISAPSPRKGDVVCLSYDTLDDRGMRRLEGRSDHRPVIGSYAVYI